MSRFNFLETWYKTKTGVLVLAVFELGFAYVFASWALDSGSWLDYLFTFLFLFGSLHNLANVTRTLLKIPGKMPQNGKRKTAKA